jgi:hypothetical protein
MKIDVCGQAFELILKKEEGGTHGNDTYGYTYGKDGKIVIDGNMPKIVQDATIVHEWLHAILEVNGINHKEIEVSVLANELYRNGFMPKISEK